MFPSKSMVDYMSEISRLFPRPNENDLYSTQYQSPLSGANRSSSSADSTSPESFPELQMSPELIRRPCNDLHTPRQSQDQSPEQAFTGRRQRPIIGRKIIPTTEPNIPSYGDPRNYSDNNFSPTWSAEDTLFLQNTPPKFYVEQTKYQQNVFYELFPSENRGYEFTQLLTPVKQGQPMSVTTSPVSPSYMTPMTSVSPMTNASPMSPTSYDRSPHSFPQSYASLAGKGQPGPRFGSPSGSSLSNYGPNSGMSGSRYQSPDLRQKMCTFCRKNGETPVVFMTHTVKERVGNKHVVTCPILRSHVCSTCGGTGDDAHTITYCPVLRSSNNGFPLQSTTITLKNTRVKSNGRRRY